MHIPLVDLKVQYESLRDQIDTAIRDIIHETAFIGGKYVQAFEKEFARANGVRYCISCANGTDAIYITLKSLGIGPGDEVITVANSWISTSETITQAGAKPVFIDIHPDYYTIDISKIEEKINHRTKAIIPVHLFGQPVEMEPIIEISQRYGLYLIEDCAQAHFAEYDNQRVGTFGIAGTFSFYPGKNLGAYGDAGAIITNDDELAIKAKMYANHGALSKHNHEIEGINSRLDGIQAAVLSVKLKYINNWNRKRYENALLYNDLLKNVSEVIKPQIHPHVKHVFHLYVIRTKKRVELIDFLSSKGISTGIHYPKALPFLEAYKRFGFKPSDYPVAYKNSKEILSLPMFPELTEKQIRYVVDTIKGFFIK